MIRGSKSKEKDRTNIDRSHNFDENSLSKHNLISNFSRVAQIEEKIKAFGGL
jgi:hypothetical protein